MSWTWQHQDASGAVMSAPVSEVFSSQSDAESWIGEFWPELAQQGVASVVLIKDGRTVYGPMALTDAEPLAERPS